MKKIRDHYFAAWLIVGKKLDYKKKNDCIEFDIDTKKYNELMEEYKIIQPLLKEIRKIVKLLNEK